MPSQRGQPLTVHRRRSRGSESPASHQVGRAGRLRRPSAAQAGLGSPSERVDQVVVGAGASSPSICSARPSGSASAPDAVSVGAEAAADLDPGEPVSVLQTVASWRPLRALLGGLAVVHHLARLFDRSYSPGSGACVVFHHQDVHEEETGMEFVTAFQRRPAASEATNSRSAAAPPALGLSHRREPTITVGTGGERRRGALQLRCEADQERRLVCRGARG